MVNSNRYTYRVIWSDEDQEHVALCAEFPSLSYLAETPAEALQGLMDTVAAVVEDMEKEGEEVPEPISSKSYSGKFMVRIAPDKHRNLAMLAAEQGMSLNSIVADKLS